MDGFRGLLHFARDPLFALEEARRLHGDFVGYGRSPTEVRLVMNAELIDELLVHRADCLEKDPYTRALRAVLGVGLLTNEGKPWKGQRKLLAPSFQPKQIRGYAETMVRTTAELIASFGEHGVRNVSDDMMGLTLEIVARTLFGTGAIATREIGEILEVGMADFRRLTMSFRAALPAWVPFWSRIRFNRARLKLTKILMQVIEARRRAPLGDDMLSRLLEAKDDDGHGMSDQQLIDECLTILIAGHETTALGVSYALYQLAQDPALATRANSELESVLQGAPPSLENLPQLRELRGIVRESLRLFPPVWAAGRVAIQEFSLQGEPVDVGTQLLVVPYILHRDPRYFERPLEFRPERWWNGETEQLPKGAYIPFGAGPRVCIGHHFAELELGLVLATLLQACSFEPLDDVPLRFSPSVTLRPARSVRLHVRRKSAQSSERATRTLGGAPA